MTINAGHIMTHDEWWNWIGRERRELAQALASRPLTAIELQRVGKIGYSLLCPYMMPYDGAEKQREFAALLAIQQLIQLAATREGSL